MGDRFIDASVILLLFLYSGAVIDIKSLNLNIYGGGGGLEDFSSVNFFSEYRLVS